MKISKAINFDFKKFQERQESWRNKIWSWWIYTRVGSWWTDFTNGVKQLIVWRKVIYNTHEYDYTDIYTLIRFKLKRLADGIERRELVVGWEDDVRWIRVCERLCDKLETEQYKMEYFEFVDKCRKEGITAPIIPGLKPLSTKKQLNLIPHRFNVDLPDSLIKEVLLVIKKHLSYNIICSVGYFLF